MGPVGEVFAADDPTGELGAARGGKERLRLVLACRDLDAADTARGLLGIAVLAADTDETRQRRHPRLPPWARP